MEKKKAEIEADSKLINNTDEDFKKQYSAGEARLREAAKEMVKDLKMKDTVGFMCVVAREEPDGRIRISKSAASVGTIESTVAILDAVHGMAETMATRMNELLEEKDETDVRD